MADISFNTACKELKIAQIAQFNQLFQPLHLAHIYGHRFYSVSGMLLSKNVNNDVSKDSPILNFVSHYCLCTIDDVISDQICITGKLEYLWNKKRYHKKKNTVLFYFEKPFKRAYLLNDLFLGSCAL